MLVNYLESQATCKLLGAHRRKAGLTSSPAAAHACATADVRGGVPPWKPHWLQCCAMARETGRSCCSLQPLCKLVKHLLEPVPYVSSSRAAFVHERRTFATPNGWLSNAAARVERSRGVGSRVGERPAVLQQLRCKHVPTPSSTTQPPDVQHAGSGRASYHSFASQSSIGCLRLPSACYRQ